MEGQSSLSAPEVARGAGEWPASQGRPEGAVAPSQKPLARRRQLSFFPGLLSHYFPMTTADLNSLAHARTYVRAVVVFKTFKTF